MTPTFHQALQALMQPEALGAPKPSTPGNPDAAGASQNVVASSRSQTGFTGVTLHKRTQRYEAHIWAEKKQIYLGSYNIKSQAARVHDIMALKIGKAGGAAAADDFTAASGGGGGTNSSSGGEINYPLADYKFVQPLLSSISQHDLVVTLRNYGKSLNASGHPNTATANPPATTITPELPDALGTAAPPGAASSRAFPINLPPQNHHQFHTNPILSLSRAASMPDDRRSRKRKQERPSSALDNPHWYPPEEQQFHEGGGIAGIAGGFWSRGPTTISASPPAGLPRPNKILGAGSGSVTGGVAPLPLFQVARQQQQQQLKADLASSNFADLPQPPPLQLQLQLNQLESPQQQHFSVATAATSAPAVMGVTHHRFVRTPRKRENEA